MISIMRLGDATVEIETRRGLEVLEVNGKLAMFFTDPADVAGVRVTGCTVEGRSWGDDYASITDPDRLVGAVAIHDDESPTGIVFSHRNGNILRRNKDKEWASER